MKKILMRAAMSPLESLTPFEMITTNSIGNNMGNMLFPYSVCRTLMTEDTTIDTIRMNHTFTREEIAKINREYDYLVLPFANAFRISFIPELKCITNLVKGLRIPCVVVGVGMQAKLGKELSNAELAEAVKDFVKAILKRSKMLGVRGERTADYLQSLGFRPEKHFTVIGCPSLFAYGKDLPKPRINPLTPDSRISTNSKISLPQNFHTFLHRTRQEIKNSYYVPQVIEEIYRMYCGMPFPPKFAPKIPEYFPADFSHPIYTEDRARAFCNVKSWLEFLGQMDFSTGSRIHGNIAAILAGTPAYVFVSDQRILELVEYHHIPYSMISDITDETSIFDIYEKTDFNQVLDGHEERFMHYLDFLRKNKLPTIYDKEGNSGRVYFDEKLAELDFAPSIHALSAIPVKEQAERLDAVLGRLKKRAAK